MRSSSSPSDRPWTQTVDGLVVTVRLTPKAGRDSIDGITGLADGSAVLKARVAAAPTEGKANDSLTRMLARQLGATPSDVTLASGATSRIKRVLIKGDLSAVAAALEKIREAGNR